MKNANELKILIFDNAMILPQKQISDGPRWGLGGVIDSKNEFIQESFYDGGWGTHGGAYSWDDLEDELNESAVYIGLYTSHWGHFLIDMCTRMWAIPKILENDPNVKIAYLGEEAVKGNNKRFLNLLGVRDDQLIHITKPTKFKKVYLPQQGFKSCEWYTQEHLTMLNQIVNTAMSSHNDFSGILSSDKIYFSRRNFAKARAEEFGEEYFENIFKKNGYQIMYPEKMTLEEQIYVWNNTTEITCINGTIPLNVVFCTNNRLKLTVLNKTSIVHENPYILLEMRNINAEFIDIYKEPIKGYPKSLGEGPFMLWPTDAFDHYCDSNQLDDYLNRDERKRYFGFEECKYYFSVIAIKKRLRKICSKYMPKMAKTLLKQVLRIK